MHVVALVRELVAYNVLVEITTIRRSLSTKPDNKVGKLHHSFKSTCFRYYYNIIGLACFKYHYNIIGLVTQIIE